MVIKKDMNTSEAGGAKKGRVDVNCHELNLLPKKGILGMIFCRGDMENGITITDDYRRKQRKNPNNKIA